MADVHFNANVADVAALYAEKVRINPGNYVDPGRTFKQLEYTDEEYAEEIKKIDARFVPFLNICRENNTAVRIGVNHGSLSDRIMSRYGDTPAGIVESCNGVLTHLQTRAIPQCGYLHQGIQHGGDGAIGAPFGATDAPRRHELPPTSWRY